MMSGGDGEEGDEEGSSDEEEDSEGGCKFRRACWFQQAGAAWPCGEVRKAMLGALQCRLSRHDTGGSWRCFNLSMLLHHPPAPAVTDEEHEAGEEVEAEAAFGSEADDGSEGGDMQAQLRRLAGAAGAKRKQLEASGAVDSGEEDEEEEGSGSEGEEGDSSDEEEDEEEEPADLVFPAEFAPALVQLLGSAPDAGGSGSGGKPVLVSQIALPDPELQLQVAAALWDAGVLCTVKAPAKQPKQKAAAKQQQKGMAKQQKQKHAGQKDGHAAAPAGGGKKQAAGPKPKKQRKA